MAKDDPIGIEMGKHLAAMRSALDLTQEQLAKQTGWTLAGDDDGRAAGLSPSRIANYEHGTRRIGVEEAEIFSAIFHLPAAYFMCLITEAEAHVLQALRNPPTPKKALSR